jgi:hypothetical protein
MAIKYIHLNPLRSGMVVSLAELGKYPWTGHSQILAGYDRGWINLGLLQEIFSGPGESNWKNCYRICIEEEYRVHDTGGFDEREMETLGVDLFQSKKNGSFQKSHPPDKFFAILAHISGRTGIPTERILGRSRKYDEVRARRDVLRACRSELRVPISHVCRWLGITEGSGGYLLRSGNPSYHKGVHRNVPVLT